MREHVPHILIVDDHREIRELIGTYLEKNGLRVTKAQTAMEARKILDTAVIDLAVLDIMLPGEDGLSLCRHLHESGTVPVILLSAMTGETDRVVGLEIGGDDYLTKPFSPRELLARIRAVLRRSQDMIRTPFAKESSRFSFDRFILDMQRHELVEADGTIVPLSTAEFKLLIAFLRHPNKVLSRDQLMDMTSGRIPHVFDRSIDNQISRLRKKIEADPDKPALIKTVWGSGYILTTAVAEM